MPIRGKKVVAEPVKRLKLSQLLKATPSDIIARANTQCRVVRKQYAVGSRDGFRRTQARDRNYYNELRLYSVCTDGKRSSFVRFYGPPKEDTPVWVWCSCEAFLYNLEVVLARFNSSSIRSSNGALPKVRNPRMIPYLCKHLVVAAKAALRERKDLAKERIREEQKRKKAEAKKLQLQPGPKIPKGRFTRPDFVELPR